MPVSLLVFFLAVHGSSAHLPGSCVASICLDTGISERQFVAHFGPGEINSGNTHCYVLPEVGLYFAGVVEDEDPSQTNRQINLVYLGRTPHPSCAHWGFAKHRPSPLGTREGLRIGDPERRVYELYASQRPFMKTYFSRRDGSKGIYFGPRHPDESLLEIGFTIKGGIVVGITVSDQE
jgi:hypothetical protein